MDIDLFHLLLIEVSLGAGRHTSREVRYIFFLFQQYILNFYFVFNILLLLHFSAPQHTPVDLQDTSHTPHVSPVLEQFCMGTACTSLY